MKSNLVITSFFGKKKSGTEIVRSLKKKTTHISFITKYIVLLFVVILPLMADQLCKVFVQKTIQTKGTNV